MLRIRDSETAPERDAPRRETGGAIYCDLDADGRGGPSGAAKRRQRMPRVRPELAARIVVYYH